MFIHSFFGDKSLVTTRVIIHYNFFLTRDDCAKIENIYDKIE